MTWWGLILIVYALLGAFHAGGVVALEQFGAMYPEHQPEDWKDDRPPWWFLLLVGGVLWPLVWVHRRQLGGESDEQHLD